MEREPFRCQKEPLTVSCDYLNKEKTIKVAYSGWSDFQTDLSKYTATMYHLKLTSGSYKRGNLIDSMDSYSSSNTFINLIHRSLSEGFYDIELKVFDKANNYSIKRKPIQIVKINKEYFCYDFPS